MIYRHPTDHSLGGVCAGLADFVGWDPVLVRALWVVATFVTSGAGFLVYLLLWLLLPVGTQAAGQMRPAALQFSNMGGARVAMVLLALGGLWLLSNLGILPALTEMGGVFLRIFFGPLLLIGVGLMLLRGRGDGLRMRFNTLRSRVGTRMRGASLQMPRGADLRSAAADAQARAPFRRSRSNRMVLGVCGGMSDKLGIDANLIRLMWVILSLGTMGLGVFVYLVVALIVPEEGSHWAPNARGAEAQAEQTVQDVPVMQAETAQPSGQPTQTPAGDAPTDVSPIGSEIVHF